jgi:hypothetical protein
MIDSARLFWGHARRTGEDSEPGIAWGVRYLVY